AGDGGSFGAGRGCRGGLAGGEEESEAQGEREQRCGFHADILLPSRFVLPPKVRGGGRISAGIRHARSTRDESYPALIWIKLEGGGLPCADGYGAAAPGGTGAGRADPKLPPAREGLRGFRATRQLDLLRGYAVAAAAGWPAARRAPGGRSVISHCS